MRMLAKSAWQQKRMREIAAANANNAGMAASIKMASKKINVSNRENRRNQ